MTALKIGFIGVGGIAQGRHLPAFSELKGKVEFTAVHDVNKERASEVAERFSIPLVFDEAAGLLEEVDAVVICTPNKFHADMAIAALQAGVHVLCEKPMAVTAAEGEAMVRAAKQHQRVLLIGYHYRYTPEADIAKKVVSQGEIGEPLVARVQAMRRRKVPGWGVFTNKELQGGGSLIDFGCHLLDLALWLLDDPEPVEVTGTTYNRLSKTPGLVNDWGSFDHETFDVDDHVTSYITFTNGLSMQFECSWAANIKEDHTSLSLSGVDGGMQVYPFELYQAKYGSLWDSVVKLPEAVEDAGVLQARHFVNCCLGEEEPIVQPEQALRVNRMIEAIYQSSSKRSAVRLS
ncbi:Gfo/Idh/MocA family protein [Salibacterium aidingense]|uniref:Gfo/Idh/MocA family protein n=1 Tax=Salibacterium aidingense TaxID=384933 RepID=UPI000406DD9F|nr:Gfo/Idh/MocA family oxidoreductase [Salibacterium aidingense]